MIKKITSSNVSILSSCLFFIFSCSTTEKPLPSDEVVIKKDFPAPTTPAIKNNPDPSHTHTIIPPQQEPIIKQPKWVEQRALTHKERFTGVLDAHNKVRAKHRIPPLKWSNKLAQYSQQWANQMAKTKHCSMYHRKGNPPFGENLYRSTAIIWTDGRTEISPVTIKKVVKAWTDEERWYDYKRNRCQRGKQCGHYTQAVWKSTTEVGCAMNVCADKSQTWVCSYNPPGNYTGVRPY